MTPKEIEQADLFWDAFQYVGDEMTPTAREAFEVRLEADQSTREAVGQVVELAQLVEAVDFVDAGEDSRPAVQRVGVLTPASTVSSAWMQPVGWVALGAAACLAVVMAFQSMGLVGGIQLADKGPAPTDWTTEDLALAWAQTQAADEASAESNPALAATDAHDPADAELVADESAEVAPAWLLAAVAHDSAYDDLEN